RLPCSTTRRLLRHITGRLSRRLSARSSTMGPTGHLKTNTTRRPDLTALPWGRLSAHVERSSRNVFCRNLARHGFNFFRMGVFSIAPGVLDSHERDRAKARSDGMVGDKDVSAFRFCHEGVKVALNRTPYHFGQFID